MHPKIHWNEREQRYEIREPATEKEKRITHAIVYHNPVQDALGRNTIYLIGMEECGKRYFKVGTWQELMQEKSGSPFFDFTSDKSLAKDLCHEKAIEIAKKLAKDRNCDRIEDIFDNHSEIIIL